MVWATSGPNLVLLEESEPNSPFDTLTALTNSGSAKYTNISRRNQVSMALFLCANIHQGDKLFSVHSGGKQCAFTSLRRFLQPKIIPIGIVLMVAYRTFDNFMTYSRRQNVKMYL
jgi:hypothetical protein